MSPHTRTTQQKITACEALGLSYWADHPAAGCVWAVDDNQQAHAVRWYRKTNEVCLVKTGDPRPPYIAAPKKEWVYPTYDISDRVKVLALTA